MTAKNESACLGSGGNFSDSRCSGNDSEVEIIQLDSSDEKIENEIIK